MKLFATTALAATLALPGLALAQSTDAGTATGTQAIDAGRIVSLAEWRYDDLYANGMSAETFIDEIEVYGQNGEELGDVEDLIVDAQGNILSVVAEVGGTWDIGDTHVSIPWDQVEVNAAADRIVVPLTEETAEEFDVFAYSGLPGSALGEQVTMGVDDTEMGPRAWRLSELIGDYARLRDGEGMANYGYVDDVIVKDGKIAATVVEARGGYEAGYYAYPFYGYDADYGWTPGDAYYDLPYDREQVGELEAFEPGNLGVQ